MAETYREDLAHIHHAGFGGLARGAAPYVLGLLETAPRVHGLVVELGCGSGILLERLTSAGYRALGVDASPAMLRLAGATAPAASLRRGSLWRSPIPPCDAVLAVGEALCYASRRGLGDRPTERLFARVARALPPGGVFLFDVMVTARAAPAPYRSWEAGDGWAVVVEVKPAGGRRLTRAITTFRRVRGRWRRDEETHTVRLFERADLVRQLRHAGFAVRTARAYGGSALPPGRTAFLARKRA
ncbi:MAG TPA: class I SAM-dependent methyltransferase [Thermoanaerobaculaceae bacterium]|nr:class I SAM-dependent methyltransferase [Thermoanaerobaculaceae bacterium]